MTDAEMALLSLLAEKPRYGYEIEQLVEARGMRQWTDLGFSSIYYLLRKLQAQGRLQGRRMPGKSAPSRITYSLTPAGASALHHSTMEALASPGRPASSFLLGLSNLPVVTPAQARRSLGQYVKSLEVRIRRLAAERRAQQPLPYFVDALFSYSLTQARSELAWVRRFRASLVRRKGQPPSPRQAVFPIRGLRSKPSSSRRRRHEET